MRNFMARGEGKAGCIIWSFLLIAVAMVSYKVIPAKVASMQLEDYMEELAMMQSTARKPNEFFVKEIKRRADELRLPVKEKDISVKKSPQRVVMDVTYTVVLDLVVTEYPLTFDLHIDRQIFLT